MPLSPQSTLQCLLCDSGAGLCLPAEVLSFVDEGCRGDTGGRPSFYWTPCAPFSGLPSHTWFFQGLAFVICASPTPGSCSISVVSPLQVALQQGGFPQDARGRLASELCWRSTSATSLRATSHSCTLSSEGLGGPLQRSLPCGSSSALKVVAAPLSALPVFLNVFFASH